MKAGAEQPQGQVELGSQEKDKEALLECELAVQQAEPDLDRHHGGAQRGDPLQNQGREKGHAQHTHRRAPKLVADLGDGADLLPAAAEEFEGRQSLEHIQKVGAHAAERAPLLLRQAIGQPPNEDHEQRDEGCGEEHDQARGPIEGEDKEQDGQRHKGSQGQLGQVLAEIGVEGLDALDGRVGQFTAALATGVGRAQGRQVGGELGADVALDTTGHGIGRHLCSPGQSRPQQTQDQEGEQQGCHRFESACGQKDLAHDPAEDVGLQDNGHAAQKTQPYSQQQGKASRPGPAQETPVEFHRRIPVILCMLVSSPHPGTRPTSMASKRSVGKVRVSPATSAAARAVSMRASPAA